MCSELSSALPFEVIDISAFDAACDTDTDAAASAHSRIAQQFIHSFEALGFVYISGHGVPTSLVQEVFELSERFFAQSEADKRKCAYRAPVPRGFIGLERENFACLAGHEKPNDLVEKFRIGPELLDNVRDDPYYTNKDAKTMFFPNMWPENLPECRPLLLQYYATMETLMQRLFRIFESALSLPPFFFRDKVDKHTSILSLNRYPYVKHPKKDQLRIAAHTDVDLFTIVAQDEGVGGLEILSPATNTWLSVPYVPDTFVVNIGDALRYWTNDQWQSTMHRVVLPPEDTYVPSIAPRHAIAFFVGANYDAELECLPSCRDDEHGGPNYPTTTYIGWRKLRIKQALSQMKK